MPLKNLLNQNIAKRILFAFFFFSSILTMLSISYVLYTQYENDKEEIIKKSHQLISSQADSLSKILWDFNLPLAKLSIKSLSDTTDLSYIAIVDDKNAVFSSHGDTYIPYITLLEIPLTIKINNETRRIGAIKAHITTTSAKEHVKSNFLNILWVQIIKSTITSFIFLLLIYHIIIKHIHKITRDIVKKSQNPEYLSLELFQLDRPHKDDELQLLVDTLNESRKTRNNYLKSLITEKEKLSEEALKRKKAEEKVANSHQQLLYVLNSLTVAVFSCKHDGEILFMNYNALKLLDHHDASQATTKTTLYINNIVRINKEKDIDAKKINITQMALKSERIFKTNAYYVPTNGDDDLTPIEFTLIPHKATKKLEKSNFIVVIKDKRNQERFEAMTHMVSHDYLTKIYNRMYLTEQIEKVLTTGATNYSLAIIDLDKFKNVNDKGGHAAGDQLLQLISKTIPKYLTSNNTFARIGGDEFSILFNCPASQSKEIATKIINALENLGFTYDGCTYEISCSIGITDLLSNDQKVEQVMSRADQACYQVKNAGKGDVIVFEGTIRSHRKATTTA